MDFMEDFDNDDDDDEDSVPTVLVAGCFQPDVHSQVQPDVQSQPPVAVPPTHSLVSVPEIAKRFHKLSKVGKVGHGRHDHCAANRQLLAAHMRSEKARRSYVNWSTSITDIMSQLQVKCKSNIRIQAKRRGVQQQLFFKIVPASKRGNRHARIVPYSWFLDIAFNKRRFGHYVGLTRTACRMIKTLVAGTVMAQQARILAKLCLMARCRAPAVFLTRLKWDETGESITVNLDSSTKGQHASTWQIMVVRITLLLHWHDGCTIVMQLVKA
jgi:hypothetical protein